MFFSLEKDARLITLEEELQQLRGQVEQTKAESKVSVCVRENVRIEVITLCKGGEKKTHSFT